MDHRIGRGRPLARIRAARADQLRHARDTERVGKPQHFLDPMQSGRGGDAAGQQRALHPAVEVRRHRRYARASGGDGETGRTVAALRGDREVVAAEQPRSQAQRLRRRRLRRNGHDIIEIGIADKNSGGVGEYKRVDAGLRPGAPQAADQRRREQHIAETAQGHHQDARPGRKLEPVHEPGAALASGSDDRCTMPATTPTPKA